MARQNRRRDGSRHLPGKTPAKRAADTKHKPKAVRRSPVPPGPRPTPSPEGDDRSVTVTLRTNRGDALRFPTDRTFQQAAMQWSYLLRNRRRWLDLDGARDLADRVTAAVDRLFLDQALVDRMIAAPNLEVSIPFTSEEVGWEARIFPWEYVLSTVRRGRRGDDPRRDRWRPLTVVRHLERAPSTIPAPAYDPWPVPQPAPIRLLIVCSAPGEVNDEFNLEPEAQLVVDSLRGPAGRDRVPDDPGQAVSEVRLVNPSKDRLRAAVQTIQPHVVHLAGIDNHQATTLVPALRGKRLRDGMLLATDEGYPEPVEADELAAAVNAAAVKPQLVTCNFWNTAARVTAQIVAGGAAAAIGFQDEIDDEAAENFLARFYTGWRKNRFDTLRAFRSALRAVRGQSLKIQGTGVVLWSARSLVLETGPDADEADPTTDPAAPDSAPAEHPVEISCYDASPASLPPTTAPTPGTTGPPPGGPRRGGRRAKDATPPGPPPAVPPAAVPAFRHPRDILEVVVLPRRAFNYSLLHNNQGLFTSFIIRVRDPRILDGGIVRDVRVETVLHVGTDSFPCRLTCDLVKQRTDLDPQIRVALTSAMTRALRESVHTSLYLRVEWDGVEIYQNTHRVALLPIDEWVDDEKQTNRNWLPSFVLPRDPAVPRVIDRAQRYLMSLLDDAAAGFDSYQSLGANPDDPTAAVDMQVRAIWSALLQEYGLSYVNPPPVYSQSSQRLRTPTDVVDGRRGTCIDLALLLAACCEYVDIYPVIFLLRGHAFAGYWRDSAEHDRFIQMKSLGRVDAPADPAAVPCDEGARGSAQPWLLDNDSYPEVLAQVQAGHLVPVETTFLTRHGAFREATQQGANNLASRYEFDSMVDVVHARRYAVTPLPVEWGAAR